MPRARDLLKGALGSKEALKPVDWRESGPLVIGVDEVGRGCLAGPVFAAAVLFEGSRELGDLESSVKDSKRLSPRAREALAIEIRSRCRCQVASASVEEIDELNILQASLLAMHRAVVPLIENLVGAGEAVPLVIVDGNFRVPDLEGVSQMTLVQGDSRCAPVSAASIVAKVARDQFMTDLAREESRFGFEVHKGYGTAAHLRALSDHGPSSWHRRSFRGVKELLID